MMRYHAKGGIWNNSEDEILKASVMKYGLNQWSRISSLLVRKSPKQCKERWYEWLSPDIKKIDWSTEEDEKLLKLSKMFPCQWKTIGTFIGRTAYQCMEHYEYLLDTTINASKIQEEHINSDIRKLKAGEIDPNPEAKPARPDPIDLDENAKDMLLEAKARIANRRGKKAKRKARQKIQEESRRLASLQKKRELKSAGIEMPIKIMKKKKNETDYNEGIPFNKEIIPGYTDFEKNWEEEDEDNFQEPTNFLGASLSFMENKNRDKDEEKMRQVDSRRMNNMKQKDIYKSVEIINRLNDPQNLIKKVKLSIPEPKYNDKNLKEILGNNTINSESLINEHQSTNLLNSDYLTTEVNNLLNMRTPLVESNLEKEIKLQYTNLNAETPLIGGEYAEEDLNNYLLSIRENDSLLNKKRIKDKKDQLKDKLSLNTSINDNTFLQERKLLNLFSSLPIPKNEFELENIKTENLEIDNRQIDNILSNDITINEQQIERAKELIEKEYFIRNRININNPNEEQMIEIRTFENQLNDIPERLQLEAKKLIHNEFSIYTQDVKNINKNLKIIDQSFKSNSCNLPLDIIDNSSLQEQIDYSNYDKIIREEEDKFNLLSKKIIFEKESLLISTTFQTNEKYSVESRLSRNQMLVNVLNNKIKHLRNRFLNLN